MEVVVEVLVKLDTKVFLDVLLETEVEAVVVTVFSRVNPDCTVIGMVELAFG